MTQNQPGVSTVKPELMLIGGQLVASDSGEWDEVINPANEEIMGRVPAANAVDVNRAVEAAKKAAPRWADL